MKKLLIIILIILSFCCGIIVGENSEVNFLKNANTFYNFDVELYGCPRAKKVAKPRNKWKISNKF